MTTGAATGGPLTRRWRRIALALGSGGAATLLVAVVVGLLTGRIVGAEDNADGYRLFCGVGLLPRTVDLLSSWKGGVVTEFTVGSPSCGMSVPSSAALVLHAARWGRGATMPLTAVAWWYAALVGVVVAVAAAALSGPVPGRGDRPGTTPVWRPWRVAVLVVPVAPLALAAFSRFFLSTYAEPAGLLGTLALACGVAVLLVTGREERRARLVALGLVVLGGGIGATAKPGYLPLLLVAIGVVAVVAARDGVRLRRVPRSVGIAAAVVAVAAVAVPIWGAVHFQDTIYEGANAHDVAFTLALTELGPAATGELGLPPQAASVIGDGFFNGPPRPTAAWWVDVIRDHPGALRTDALAAVAERPGALLRALGVGLQATTRADLPYLASGPADPARFSALGGDPGWSGARQPDLRAVLDTAARPAWLPTALTLTAFGAALSTPAWRRRQPAAARWCRAAGLAAATGLGLVVMALIGDGYFEVFKHVWLAAYALALVPLCLVGAVAATLARSVRMRVARF